VTSGGMPSTIVTCGILQNSCRKTTVLKIVVDMFTDPVILESRD